MSSNAKISRSATFGWNGMVMPAHERSEMRYRIYFKDKKQCPAEVECLDIRVTGHRRVKAYCLEHNNDEDCVDIFFGDDIKRIADDHDRTIFEA